MGEVRDVGIAVGDEHLIAPPPDHTVRQPGAQPGPLRDFTPGAAFARFMILGKLGQGGSGVVYAAYDPQLDRKVALKLLRDDHSEERTHLLSEAQAMARLAHANVLSVHEVGTYDNQDFIVMDLVDGGTLRTWMAAGPHPWREVVARFLAAGRGLSAAHEAGIVHRDFKPDNVLLGKADRVLVTDFGIAGKSEGPEVAEASNAGAAPVDPAARSMLSRVRGTPGYIAPELYRGRALGPAADQFSFCVALYEGLHQHRPFEANDEHTTLAAIDAGLSPASARDVPAALTAIVRRGLASDPTDRYPSMQDLLDALARCVEPRRRRLIWVAAGVAMLGILIPALARHDRGPECDRAADRVRALWNGAARAELTRGFLATGRPNAAAAAARTAAIFDQKSASLAQMRIEACRATNERGEQSAPLLDLRMRCLDRNIDQLGALLDLLRTPDAQLVERATTAANEIGDLRACADTEALTAAVPLPSDPTARAAISALTSRLDPIHARYQAGKYKDGLAAITELAPRIVQVNHAPLVAEALFLQAALQDRTGGAQAAETTLYRALDAAGRAHDDFRFARGLIELIWVLGVLEERHPEATALAHAAEAAVSRVKDPQELRGQLHGNLGMVYSHQGKLAESRRSFQLAYDELRSAPAPNASEIATTLSNLGLAAWQEGKLDEARDYYEQGLALRRKVLEPDNTDIAESLINISAVLATQRKFAEARDMSQRALAILERAVAPSDTRIMAVKQNLASMLHYDGKLVEARQLYEELLRTTEEVKGKDHPDVADVLDNLGNTLVRMKDYASALAAQERALAIRRAAYGPDHAAVGRSLNDLGDLYNEQHQRARARDYFEQSLAVRRKALGDQHPDVAESLANLAELLRDDHRCDRGRELYARAFAILTAIGRADGDFGDHVRVGLAECLIELGNLDDAERQLRAAWPRLESGQDEPADRAAAHFAMARASYGKHPAEAVALAQTAREEYAAQHNPDREPAVIAWLRHHGTAAAR